MQKISRSLSDESIMDKVDKLILNNNELIEEREHKEQSKHPFLVNKEFLISCGVPKENIIEMLDWGTITINNQAKQYIRRKFCNIDDFKNNFLSTYPYNSFIIFNPSHIPFKGTPEFNSEVVIYIY